MKKRAAVALLVFLVILTCFSILSRAISSSGVAMVTTAKTTTQTISHQVKARGIVEYAAEVAILSESEQFISTMHVREGDQVQTGDVLFAVDADVLNESINSIDRDLEKIDLQLESLQEKNLQPQGSSDLPGANNSSSSSGADYSKESLQIDRQALQIKFDRLFTLRDNGYKVYAPHPGTITSIMVPAGNMIGGSAVLLMSYPELGLLVQSTVSEEDAEKLGSKIIGQVTFGDGVKIDSVSFNTVRDSEGAVILSAELNAEDILPGTGADITFDLSASEHKSCIPLEALHQNGSLFYVFVSEERSGFFETDQVARKVNVTVLDTGNGYAALNAGEISSQQEVLVRSNKVVEENDRIRTASV